MTLVNCQPTRHANPFAGLSILQRHLSREFGDALAENSEEGRTVTWSPRVNLTESDDKYEVTAELAGLTREDVKVELQENILTISGEKQNSTGQKEQNLFLSERHFGQFRRRFQFPTQIDGTKIDATFKNGVLTVTLPKAEVAKPTQIEVKIN